MARRAFVRGYGSVEIADIAGNLILTYDVSFIDVDISSVTVGMSTVFTWVDTSAEIEAKIIADILAFASNSYGWTLENKDVLYISLTKPIL